MRIQVTGHRPKKFNNNYNIYSEPYISIGRKMRSFIINKMNEFPNEKIVLVTGMAMGIDTVWALVGIKLKKQYPDRIEVEAFVPCKDHSSAWYKTQDIERHIEILEGCDTINILDVYYNQNGDNDMRSNKKFSNNIKQRYESVFNKAHMITFDRPLSGPAVMNVRNAEMVKSLTGTDDYVYAVWDGTKGGTGNCVKIAKDKKKNIEILNPKELS